MQIQAYALHWLSFAVQTMQHHCEIDGVVLPENLVEELELCFSIEACMRLRIGDVQVSLFASII